MRLLSRGKTLMTGVAALVDMRRGLLFNSEKRRVGTKSFCTENVTGERLQSTELTCKNMPSGWLCIGRSRC